MNLTNGFRLTLREKFSRVWLLLWAKLDVKVRRMCLMSSLHAQLFACTDNDCDKINKLNSKLHLVGEDYQSALRLPTLFGSKIWRTIKPLEADPVLNEHFFRRIAKLTPCWLLYTDHESFIADLKVMVGYGVEEYNLTTAK